MKKINFLIILFFLALPIFAQEKTHTQIEELYGDAIVSINIIKKDGSTYSGTGFIINSDGLIATAGHVVDEALAINCTFKNGVISKEATLLAKSADKITDLALIKIPNTNLPYVILGDSNQVRAGQEITVIGNPRRLQNTITNGLISQLRQVSPTIIWLQISAPISPSSSGSPVFNKQGQVIGVVTSTLKGEEIQNINFAVPSNYLLTLMYQNNIPLTMAKMQDTQMPQPSFFTRVKNHFIKAWNILKQLLSSIFG